MRIPISSKLAVSFIKILPMVLEATTEYPSPTMRIVGIVCSKGRRSVTASRKSVLNRLDVYGIGASKQRSKIEKCIGGLISRVKVGGIVNLPRVSCVIVSTASNAAGVMRGGKTSPKNPKRLVGVVLAGINVDVQLRSGGGCRPNQSHSRQAESRPFRP